MTNTSNNSGNFQCTLFNGVPWMVVYAFEAILILTGNSISIYIFWSIRKRLKRASYLLINLAVADILVGIAVTLWLWAGIAVILERDVSYNVGKTATMIDLIGTTCSVLSLALISLERMLAILWPFRHRLLSEWYYHVSVGFVWFVSALNMFLNVHIDPDTTKSDNSYNILTATTFISSILIITGAYLAIWISTRRKKMANSTRRSTEQNRKLAKTLFLVTALSIITCLPYGITIAFKDFLQHLYSFRVQITFAVQYANSFLNPVVYCFKMPEFKESLRKFICRCSRQRRSFKEYSSETNSGIILRSLKTLETF